MTLDLSTDRSLVRAAARSIRYLRVSFAAPVAPSRADRRPLTVAFVLDRSGSMGGEKIRLARQAVDTAVLMLKPEDLFSVVVYDDRVDVLVSSTHATSEARRLAADRLAAIDARGSTDLCSGWLRGCEQVAEGLSADRIARCLLISDGLANVGTTNPEELAGRAAKLRTGYVVTSTLGVGAHLDERLMASMARAGGGNYYYIEQARQIEDMLTSELGEALEVVARRAVVNLDLPEGVDAEFMHDFRAEAHGRRMRIELNDLVSGQDVSLVVKLCFPRGEVGTRACLRASLSSEDETIAGSAEIGWTFADHAANDVQPRDRRVDRLVAALYAVRARRDAVEHNRAGDFDGAVRMLGATQQRISSYAGTDAELNRIAATLESAWDEFNSAMDPSALKKAHWANISALRMKDPDGKAVRVRSKLSE